MASSRYQRVYKTGANLIARNQSIYCLRLRSSVTYISKYWSSSPSATSSESGIEKPRRHTRKHRFSGLKVQRKSTVSTEVFLNESRKLLNLIYDGSKEIEETDPNVSIEYYVKPDSQLKDAKIINIHVESTGSYQVLIDDSKHQITMFSPISFTNIYIYNEDQNEWQSTIDGHYLIELLARELNDHCHGMPKF